MFNSVRHSMCLCLSVVIVAAPVFGAPAEVADKKAIKSEVVASVLADCKKNALDVVNLPSMMKAAPPETLPNLLGDEGLFKFEFFMGCVSSVPGGRNHCERFKELGGALPEASQRCRDLVGFVTAVRCTVKHENSAACAPFSSLQPSRKEDVSRVCDAYQAALKKGQGLYACEKVGAGGTAKELDDCRNVVACLESKPYIGEDEVRSLDKWFAKRKGRFLAAVRSGDAAACADAPLCGVLAGRGQKACAPYQAVAKELICNQVKSIAAARAAPKTAPEPVPPALAEERRKIREENEKKRIKNEETEAQLKKLSEDHNRKMRILIEEKQKLAEESRQAEIERKKQMRLFKKGDRMEDVPPDVLKKMQQMGKSTPAPDK